MPSAQWSSHDGHETRPLVAQALHGTVWALQRDDPGAALAAAEHYLDLQREIHLVDQGGSSRGFANAGALLALAGALRARLGDPIGAARAPARRGDRVARPRQTPAARRCARLEPRHAHQARTTRTRRDVRGRTHRWATRRGQRLPDVDAARARTLERLRTGLGDETTDALVADGAAMTYDEIIEYALHHLEPE